MALNIIPHVRSELTAAVRKRAGVVPVISQDSGEHDAPLILIDIGGVALSAHQRGADPRDRKAVGSYDAAVDVTVQCAGARPPQGPTSQSVAEAVVNAAADLNAGNNAMRWLISSVGDSDSDDTALDAPRSVDVAISVLAQVSDRLDLVR